MHITCRKRRRKRRAFFIEELQEDIACRTAQSNIIIKRNEGELPVNKSG
jgi:hypothetical protein